MQQSRRVATSQAGMKSLLSAPELKLLILWALLGAPWLLGVKIIPFDAMQQFFPAVGFVAEQLRHLQAPWWNPYLFGGYPQVADPQMMNFQPSMVLPMLLAPTSLHWFGVVVMLHVLGGGIGALRLARHYGLQALPQLLFALVMMFGAVAASRLQHTPMIVSFAYLPWLWLSLSRLRHAQRWRDALWAGLLGGLCSLQLTQVTYFIILGCAAYAVAALVLVPGARRLRLLFQLGVVGVIAAGVSAPQWLSTLAWLPYTNRSVILAADSIQGAIRWQALPTLLSGNVLEQGRGDSWALGDISQDYLYLGAVPLALWLAWGGAVVKAQPRRARVALGLLLLAVMFALGAATPLFPWLFSWLPGLDLFRRPADALFVVVPMAAWLSAHALQQALEGHRFQPHLPSLLVAVGIALQAVWLALVSGWHPTAMVWLLLSAVIGACALAAARRAAGASARAGILLLALVAVDLLVFNVGTTFNAGSAGKWIPTSTRSGGTQSAYQALQELHMPGIPERAAVSGFAALTNGAAAWQLPLVNGYNPMVSSDYADMTGVPATPAEQAQYAGASPWAPDLDASLYDLLGLRWVASASAFPGSHAFDTQVQVMRRAHVLPRVLNPRSVRRHDTRFPEPAAFAATDFTTTLWLPAGQASMCPEESAGQAQVTVLTYHPSELRLRYEADRPAWVVVNEVHAPGWTATAHGTVLPLLRGNGLFRAVCVPAGQGELVLRYSPVDLWRSAWLSLHARP